MILYVFSFIGLIYLVLMIAAFPHAKKGQGLISIGPWWCLYRSSYEDGAGKLCVYGRILLGMNLLLMVYVWCS